MKKQIKFFACSLAVLLVAALLPLSLLASSVWDGKQDTAFASGTGTAEDPYRIHTPAQLAWLSASVNSGKSYAGCHFSLEADLDLNGAEWTPIGSASAPFSGNFDGNGHVIRNALVADARYAGIFGFVTGTLRNINLEGIHILGGTYAGTLCGALQGNAERCYAAADCTVEVAADHGYAGGLLGYAFGGSILRDCYAAVPVSASAATAYAGGLLGGLSGGEVVNCFAAGNVAGTAAGGILGLLYGGRLHRSFSLSVASTDSVVAAQKAPATPSLPSEGESGDNLSGVGPLLGENQVHDCYCVIASALGNGTQKTKPELLEATFLASIGFTFWTPAAEGAWFFAGGSIQLYHQHKHQNSYTHTATTHTATCEACGAVHTEAHDFQVNMILGAVERRCALCEKNEQDQSTPYLIMESVKATAGSAVQVKVHLWNNPGISAIKLKLEYDANVIASVSADSIAFPQIMTSPTATTNPYVVVLARTDNITEDGLLLSFQLTLKPGVVMGSTPLRLQVVECINENSDPIASLAVVQGNVQVNAYATGDVNGNGTVDLLDATLLLQHLADNSIPIVKTAADVDGSGELDTLDVTALLKRLAASH